MKVAIIICFCLLSLSLVSAQTSYFYSGNHLLAEKTPASIRYVYRDFVGTDIVSKSLPFGQTIYSQARFGFTGKEQDTSGLHYFAARYYDSNLGRFTSIDPSPGEASYQYVDNDPLNSFDPDGRSAKSKVVKWVINKFKKVFVKKSTTTVVAETTQQTFETSSKRLVRDIHFEDMTKIKHHSPDDFIRVKPGQSKAKNAMESFNGMKVVSKSKNHIELKVGSGDEAYNIKIFSENLEQRPMNIPENFGPDTPIWRGFFATNTRARSDPKEVFDGMWILDNKGKRFAYWSVNDFTGQVNAMRYGVPHKTTVGELAKKGVSFEVMHDVNGLPTVRLVGERNQRIPYSIWEKVEQPAANEASQYMKDIPARVNPVKETVQ